MALLTVSEAAQRLSVKPSTLYAYVSRGVLEARKAADGTSRFDERQIDRLAARGRPRLSSKSVSINLLIESGLTTLSENGVRYRGHPVNELIGIHTFEEVAELLWTGRLAAKTVPWTGPVTKPNNVPLDQQVRIAVARYPVPDLPMTAPHPDDVLRDARQLIAGVIDSLRPVGQSVSVPLPLHQRRVRSSLASRLWRAVSPGKPSGQLLGVLNAAMVLLADHELATSALAVRVAASTLAPPAAVVLAGLGAMAGPLHGSASREARMVLLDAMQRGPTIAVHERLAQKERVGGFGHRVYAGLDPRAAALLELLTTALPGSRVLATTDQLMEVVHREIGISANIDLALAAFELAADLVPRAAETVFMIARFAGWIGHAMEEYEQPPLRFRVRAHYTGDLRPTH
jgi:citrate synthase